MNTLLASATVLANDFALDKDTVTPGVMGFLAIFAIGVCLYFLMRSLVGKLRGVSARAEEQEAAEAAEKEGPEAAAVAEASAGASSAEDPSAKA
ncbi:hypothetical protein [Nocardiopsis ganjiahuensis]|uniref:hypothetical protein n=1 Tax=Nocardiopsis ganjiahuensis TaxID=239984 RepID=UPI00037821D2|nr:hypothetical protein [Nocardiopsis ganjiahuensis]